MKIFALSQTTVTAPSCLFPFVYSRSLLYRKPPYSDKPLSSTKRCSTRLPKISEQGQPKKLISVRHLQKESKDIILPLQRTMGGPIF